MEFDSAYLKSVFESLDLGSLRDELEITVWEKIDYFSSKFGAAMDGLATKFGTMGTALSGFITSGLNAITSQFVSLVKETKVFKDIIGMVNSVLSGVVQAVVIPMLSLLVPILQALMPAFQGLTSILQALTPVFEILGFVVKVLATPIAALGALFTWVGNIFYNVGKFISNVVNHPLRPGRWDNGMRETNLAQLTADAVEAVWETPGAGDYQNSYITETGSGGGANYTAGRTINQEVNIYTDVISGEGGIRELALMIRDEIYSAEALGA